MSGLTIDINLCNNTDFIYLDGIKDEFIWNEYGIDTPSSMKELSDILNFFREEKIRQYPKINKFKYNEDDITIYQGRMIINSKPKLFIKILDPFALIEEIIISHNSIDYHHLDFVDYVLKRYMSDHNEVFQYTKNIPSNLIKFVMKIKKVELMALNKFNYSSMKEEQKIIHNMELEKINGYLAKTFFYNPKNIKKYFMSFYLQGIVLLLNLNRNGLLHMDIKYNNIMLEHYKSSIDILNYKITCSNGNIIFKLIDLDNVEVHEKNIFPYDVYLFMKHSLFYLNKDNNFKDIFNMTNEIMLKLNKGKKCVILDEGIAERSIDLEQCKENYELLDNFLNNLISLIKNNQKLYNMLMYYANEEID